MSQIKTFFKQFSQFITGGLLTMLIGFMTFPIFTRVLTKEEYAIIGIVGTTMLISVSIAKLGMSNGIIRFYEEYQKEKQDIFISTVVVFGFLISLATLSLYLLSVTHITERLGMDKISARYFLIMGVYLFIRPLNIIVINFLRVSGKTIFINLVNVLIKFIGACTSLLLLLVILKNLYGYFLGIIIGETIGSTLLFIWFFNTYDVRIKKRSWKILTQLIKFGLPLLFSEISYLLLSYADRYMILIYLDKAELGIYTVGYNLAMYLADLVVFALSYAVVPLYVSIYAQEGREKTEEFLTNCFHYLIIFMIPICFGYYICSRDAFVFFASQKYSGASEFSYLILIGNLLLGFNFIFQAGLYIKKKSWIILSIMVCGVALNIMINMILLPSYGIWGAALATLLSCVLTTVLTILLSFKYLFIKINSFKLLGHLFLSICMVLILNMVDFGVASVNLFGKILIGLIVIFVGVSILEKDIVRNIKEIILSRKMEIL